MTPEERQSLATLARTEKLRRRAVAGDFAAFCLLVGKDDRGNPLNLDQAFHRDLLDFMADETTPHKISICPPGSGKTTLQCLRIAWLIGRDPSATIILVCNTSTQAVARSMVIRGLIERSPEYHSVFPHIAPDPFKQWTQAKWQVQRPNPDFPSPTLHAGGMLGSFEGSRASHIFIDDPSKMTEATSTDQMNKQKDWIRDVLMTRRMHADETAVEVILTHFSGFDLGTYFEKDGYKVFRVPALNADDESFWPERFPVQFLLGLREKDPMAFACVFQGDPSGIGGTMLRKAWLKYVKASDVPRLDQEAAYVDMAWSLKDSADRTAMVFGGIDSYGNVYVLDCSVGKWEWNDAKPEIVKFCNRNDVYRLGMQQTKEEVLALGQLKEALPRITPEFTGMADKKTRFSAVADAAFNGKVFVLYGPWNGEWEHEITNFPAIAEKDIVDATSGLFEILGMPRPLFFGALGTQRESMR
jgi:predicted phage terminase large subunit-like protein